MLRSLTVLSSFMLTLSLPCYAASVLRTFDTHHVRQVRPLDGRWKFELLGADSSLQAHTARVTGGTIEVPSVWENIPGLENYRGRAAFETKIEAETGKAVRIAFGGVSHTADVFIDGKHYGHHYDAYTPWTAVAADLKPGGHTLRVEVDNSFGEHSALHIDNDYYTWGGITRPVELQQVPYLYLERIHARPVLAEGMWSLELEVTVANCGTSPQSGRVTVALENGPVLELGGITLGPGETRTLSGKMKCPGVQPWDAASPVLYTLTTSLTGAGSRPADDLIDRIGFRQVTTRGRDMLLNGRKIRLRGFNRHESHPQFGCAIPVEAMNSDLLLLRDLGCNFIRTSHYPNDMRFLDLCDELGMYVWEESHSRHVDFKHPMFREQITGSTTEMVENHFNHPSIIIWGSLNECESDTPEGAKVYGYVFGLIKKLDPSRPVTSASNRLQKDITLKYLDIVSWNIYTGWYNGALDGVAPFFKKLLAWMDTPESNAAGKPLIISEFGAGALYGYRDPAHPKWSEEYQADLLDTCLDAYMNNPSVTGVAIWQFCDIRVSDGWWYSRPRTMNNKGVVDQFRRPKLSYEVVKRKMHEAQARWEGN